MPLSAFDGVVYINLDYREDRKAIFLKEMKRLKVKEVHRISAHYDPLNGVRGCLISHLEALDFMEKKGWKKGLILEDDCFFEKDCSILKKQVGDFFQLAKEDWDVFLLGGWYWEVEDSKWENLLRVRYARCSHAYCVKNTYISVLKNCFKKAYDKVQDEVFFICCRPYALDVSWKELQSKDRWYAPLKQLAFQSESFSDIEHLEREERRE